MEFKNIFKIILLSLCFIFLEANSSNIKKLNNSSSVNADIYVLYAKILYKKKEIKKAIKEYIKAIKILKQSPNNLKELGVVYHDIAIAYEKTNNIQMADKYFQLSLNLSKNLKNDLELLSLIYNHYAIFLADYKFNFKKAKEYAFKSEKLTLSNLKELTLKQKIYNLLNISSLYENMGLYKKELKILKIAEKIVYNSKDNSLKTYIYLYLSDVYQKLDSLKESMLYVEKVKKILKKNKYNYMNYETIMRLAGMYRKLGLYSFALKEYGFIKKIKHPGMLYDLYNGKGICYSNLKKYDLALKNYKKALSIANNHNWQTAKASLYNNIGLLYKRKKDYKKAIKYYKKAINIHQNKKLLLRLSTNYLNIGSLYDDLKEYDKALKNYKKALNIRIKFYSNDSYKFANLYSNIAVLYFNMKNSKQALVYSRKAYKNFYTYFKKMIYILPYKVTSRFLEKNKRYINHYLEYSYINKNIIEAYDNWLNYKGSIFDSENAIATLYLNIKDKNLKADIEKLMNYKRDLAKLYQSIPKPKQREAWQKSIKELEASIESLTKKIANKANSFKELQELKNISYKDIAKNLKENQTYIDFAKAGDYYYIFTLDSKENINFLRVDKKKSKKIDSLVKSFRKDIDILLNKNLDNKELANLTKSSKEKLAKLYSAIFNPLKDIIKDKKSLIISPDGALKLIPFEAMYNKESNHYLIEEKNIKYIPSGKELVRLYKFNNTKLAKNETVIFDNPDFKDKAAKDKKTNSSITPNTNRAGIVKSLFKVRFSKLPGTKAEAKAIKETIDSKTKVVEFSNKEANEDNLLKVKEPKILHIATHGFFINDKTIPNPMLKSGVALSGANVGAKYGTGYGIVTALKLSGLKLKGTDLVVLSACETGVVDINSTESVSALGKAFIQAGAKDIVMSLWKVDDNATKELMSSFYKNMQKSKSYSKALKEAKLEMIKQNKHPFYWAPFVVSGL